MIHSMTGYGKSVLQLPSKKDLHRDQVFKQQEFGFEYQDAFDVPGERT